MGHYRQCSCSRRAGWWPHIGRSGISKRSARGRLLAVMAGLRVLPKRAFFWLPLVAEMPIVADLHFADVTHVLVTAWTSHLVVLQPDALIIGWPHLGVGQRRMSTSDSVSSAAC